MTARVPKGYKQTEVGVIPEEWEVKRIGDIALIDPDILPESTPPDYEFNYIEIENVETGTLKGFSRQIFQSAPSRARKVIRANDILLSSVRPYLKSHLLFTEQSGEWICSTGFTVIRVFPEAAVSQYVFSHFMYDLVNRQIALLIAGSNYPAISRNDVQKLFIPLPPLPEQRAIAGALGDVDSLLAALDRLIAKKRAVKAAAMDDLLTGRVRLPGFEGTGRFKHTEAGPVPEEWEVKQIGKLFKFLSTSSRSRIHLREDGNALYIHYGDIHTKWDFILDFDKTTVPRIDLRKVKGVDFLEEGDLVLADASEDDVGAGKAVEVQNLKGRIAVAGLHTIALRNLTGEFVNGFKAYVQAMPGVRRQIKRMVTGLKVFGISKSNLANVFVPIPLLPEQTAIAAALSDLDAELAALERERAKWQAIKQGMLDDLLTGRVRLV